MNKKGFTLIELLIVIAIIGILTGLIAVGMNGAKLAAQDSKKKATVDSIKKALIIDKVGTGKYPIESGCTIGFDCGILDPVLQQYLPPDLDGNFTYQSNGVGCTVSTILSNGYTYQYDCLTNAYSTNALVDGSCGSSDGANLSSIPMTNLCNAGEASLVSGTGPWSWTCTGYFGGTVDSCVTGALPVNGVCTVGLAYVSTPGNGSCSSGTATAVTGSGPWYWGCNGVNGGTNTSSTACSASKTIHGDCGSAAKTYSGETALSGTLCTTGSPSPASPTLLPCGTTSWTCSSVNTSNANCYATNNGYWLYGHGHTSCQCIAIGGTPDYHYSSGGAQYCYPGGAAGGQYNCGGSVPNPPASGWCCYSYNGYDCY